MKESEIHLDNRVELCDTRMRLDESKILTLLTTNFRSIAPVDGETRFKDEEATDGVMTTEVFRSSPACANSKTVTTIGMPTLRCKCAALQYNHEVESHRTLFCDVPIKLTLGLVAKDP